MLLTIIFTGKSVHTLLRRKNSNTVLKNSKSVDQINDCLRELLKSASSKGWKIAKPISTALILPNDSTEISFKINSFKKEFSNDIRVVFEDVFGNSYLKGKGKEMDNSSYILLYNFGEGSEIFTHIPNGKSSLAKLPDLNMKGGQLKLRDNIIAKLAKEGLVIDQEDENSLLKSIEEGGKGGKYVVNKKSPDIEINATINISKAEYEDEISSRRTILNQHLHPKILQSSSDLKEVILMGSFFDNQVLQDYLRKDLELKNKLSTEGITSVDKIIDNISSVGFGGIEQFLDAERKETERLSQLRARREAMHARESLLLEIRGTCVDPVKEEEYKRLFTKKAEVLNIPKEVVLWNITEVMDTIRLEQELDKKTDIPMVSAADINSGSFNNEIVSAKVEVLEAPKQKAVYVPKVEPHKPKKPVELKNNQDFAKPQAAVATKPKKIVTTSTGGLDKIFKMHKNLKALGFNTMKGTLLNESGEKILRYISKEEQKDDTKLKQFQKLFNKESIYYEKMSPIHNASFGKYYYRDVLEGEAIDVFLKKNASRFKPDIEKWSNADLKLILKIWKEVDSLEYSFRLKPENILVLSKMTWSLKREQDIKLTLFNGKESSKSEMEKDMDDILTKLFGKRTYQNLRKKFSI